MRNPFKVLAKPFTALSGKVDATVQQKILASVIRHVVSMVAGALVAHGLLIMSQTGQFEQIVGGAVLALIPLFSGAKQKKYADVASVATKGV